MRVIAGQYRHRTLRSLPGLEIRPTADRLRETLFNVLCSGNPAALTDSTWFDLYAGTGAVGIEALSRGARLVHFVESSKAAAELIGANLKSLGIERGFQIVRAEAASALKRLETASSVAESKLLRERAVVIAEHEKRFDPGEAFGELRRYRKLVQGEAALSFYRRPA
jgi:16S rRNA (guanine966-N2)-methyltransferase